MRLQPFRSEQQSSLSCGCLSGAMDVSPSGETSPFEVSADFAGTWTFTVSGLMEELPYEAV